MQVCNKADKNTEQANLLKPQVLFAKLSHPQHLWQKSQGSSGGGSPSSSCSVLLSSSSNPRQYARAEKKALSQVILRISDTRTKFQIQTQN